MSDSSPAKVCCPDFVILLPAAGTLHVFAYEVGFRKRNLLWRERVPCPQGVDPADVLSGLLVPHPMREQTAAVLFAGPETGGFLLAAAAPSAHRDRPWIERQLAQTLPYAPTDLLWRSRAGEGRVEIFWLPLAWAKAQTDALARVGLCLDEIYPRAAIVRLETRTQGVELIEEADALHVFELGLVRRSAPLPIGAEDAERAKALESLALGDEVLTPRKAALAADPNLEVRLLSLWRDGAEAIVLAGGVWSRWPALNLWAPLLNAAAACAVLLVVIAGVVSWQNDALDSALTGMAGDHRKLAAADRRFVDLEQSLVRERKFNAAVKVLDASPLPYEELNAVSAALPDKYWIQRMTFKDGALELSGRGGASDEVAGALAKRGVAAKAPDAAPGATADGFSLRVELAATGNPR